MRRFKRFVSDVVDTVMAGVMMVLLLGGSAVAAVVMIVLGVLGAAASAVVLALLWEVLQ